MRARDWITIGVVGVFLLLLWKLLSRPSTTVVNTPAQNPWVGALDALPNVLNTVFGLFKGSGGSGASSTSGADGGTDSFEGE